MATNPAAAGDRRPIIIKRKKIVAGGHHGGAWKVAYADFVTAMMAFFMVMWLVSTVSKEQRAALFDYFQNPSMEQGKAPKPAPGQAGPGGASTSPINLRGGLDAPRTYSQKPDIGGPVAQIGAAGQAQMDPTEAQKIAEAIEQKQLDTLMQDLKEAIGKSQALAPFKDQLLLDITPEGLRIQIVDAQNRPMFDLGSSSLKNYTDQILRELSPYLTSVPNRISLTGHTDTTPFASRNGYTNWELSADRANAARRALEAGGLGVGQGRARRRAVVGRAVRQDAAAQPDQPPHQHHRDDQARGGSGGEDRRAGDHPGHRRQRVGRRDGGDWPGRAGHGPGRAIGCNRERRGGAGLRRRRDRRSRHASQGRPDGDDDVTAGVPGHAELGQAGAERGATRPDRGVGAGNGSRCARRAREGSLSDPAARAGVVSARRASASRRFRSARRAPSTPWQPPLP
jgi:chemotaxis protein MotB